MRPERGMSALVFLKKNSKIQLTGIFFPSRVWLCQTNQGARFGPDPPAPANKNKHGAVMHTVSSSRLCARGCAVPLVAVLPFACVLAPDEFKTGIATSLSDDPIAHLSRVDLAGQAPRGLGKTLAPRAGAITGNACMLPVFPGSAPVLPRPRYSGPVLARGR